MEGGCDGIAEGTIPLKDLQEQLNVAGTLEKLLQDVNTTVTNIRRMKEDLSDEEEVKLWEGWLAQVIATQKTIIDAGRGGRTLPVVELAKMMDTLREKSGENSGKGILDEICQLATSVAELPGPAPLVSGDLVQLSGVLGPHCFYITRIQDEGLLNNVSLALQKLWANKSESPLILGGCAIMREDDMCYRVRVVEVELGERVKVVFLDKVGEAIVAVKSLVPLGKNGPGSWPPLAQPATLSKLSHDHLWGKEVVEEIERFGRGPCVLEVLEKIGNKMVVELKRPVNKRVPGDLVVSLSAYLTSHGYLQTDEDAILEELHCPPFMRRPPMSLNAELDVLVTQVDSGHKIWVQETDNSHLAESVKQVLKREYTDAWGDLELEVLVPFHGLRCVTR